MDVIPCASALATINAALTLTHAPAAPMPQRTRTHNQPIYSPPHSTLAAFGLSLCRSCLSRTCRGGGADSLQTLYRYFVDRPVANLYSELYGGFVNHISDGASHSELSFQDRHLLDEWK